MKATGTLLGVVAVVLLLVGAVSSQADQTSRKKSCSSAPAIGGNGGNGGAGGAGGNAVAGNGSNASPGSPGAAGTPGSGANGGNGGAGGAGGNALGGNCPAQVVLIQGGEQPHSSTFTLTVQAAGRYAVQALERARPNGRSSQLTCSQNSRNRITCQLKWSLKRITYQATLNIRYRTRSPRVAWQGRLISIR